MGKYTILYEAQDIFNEIGDRKWTLYFKLGSYAPRNISLICFNKIIVEGRGVISQNQIENYEEKIVICPQFIDTTKYYPDKEEKNTMSIAFIGALIDRKGALLFAKSIDEIVQKTPNLKIFIIGRGPLEKSINEITKKYIEDGTVELISELPEAQMRPFLASLRLLVHLSTHESLLNLILESMASGAVVLTTPVGAIPDIIKDRENGFIFHGHDEKELADRISEIVRRNDSTTISETACRTIKEHYTQSEALKRYADLFNTIEIENLKGGS